LKNWGLVRDEKVQSWEAGMNTRSSGDKSEVENLYKTAIENLGKIKSGIHDTLSTSTPIKPSGSKSETTEFLSTESRILNYSETFVPSGSDDFGDVTILAAREFSNITLGDKSDATMATHNPLATLKYAVEAVPFFDGQNIPITYFTEGCEEAKSMLPPEAESQFTKIIRTRIVGEARRTIQDQNFDTVSQLINFLKQIYGPAKNVYQLQGELGCVYQKNEEDVVTYANRVKILGKQILEAHKTSGTGLSDQNIKGSLEKDMCKCFIRGLKPEIEHRITRNLSVQDTVADALRIERELQQMTDLRQGRSVWPGPSPSKDLINNSRASCQICHKEGHIATECQNLKYDLGTEILICQICKKRGHGADKCRLRDPRPARPVNALQSNIISCQLCSKPGHNAKMCRNNNNVNFSPNKNSIVCQWCDKSGHLAVNCWQRQNSERNSDNKKFICHICNNPGHIARDCRSKLNQQNNSKNDVFCRYCKETGHLLEECQLRIASNNRRKAPHQGNSDGPSKAGVQQGPERIPHPSTSQKGQ